MFAKLIHAPSGAPATAAERQRCKRTHCEIGQLRFTAREVCFPRRLHNEFIRYDEIVWAYIRVECDTATIGLGYTSVSVSYLVLRIADGREFVMGMPTDQKADEALHMISLYAVAASENRLVAGTGHTPENCAHFGEEKRELPEGPHGLSEIPILKKKI